MTDERIERALELVNDDDRQAARDILKEVLADDPDNLEALKAYVRAARNPKAARQLLRRILEIAPGDTWAQGALETLDSI